MLLNKIVFLKAADKIFCSVPSEQCNLATFFDLCRSRELSEAGRENSTPEPNHETRQNKRIFGMHCVYVCVVTEHLQGRSNAWYVGTTSISY